MKTVFLYLGGGKGGGRGGEGGQGVRVEEERRLMRRGIQEDNKTIQ